LLFFPVGAMNVTTANAARRNSMSENTIDSESISKPAPDTAKPKGARKPAKKAKPPKKAGRVKKPGSKPKADRTNKKAEVIDMMKRAKGATLAEIMKLTEWQAHTVRGFVSILGSKGGEKIESSKNAAGERTYKIGEIASGKSSSKRRLGHAPTESSRSSPDRGAGITFKIAPVSNQCKCSSIPPIQPSPHVTLNTEEEACPRLRFW
jgi:hypothetical protein